MAAQHSLYKRGSRAWHTDNENRFRINVAHNMTVKHFCCIGLSNLLHSIKIVLWCVLHARTPQGRSLRQVLKGLFVIADILQLSCKRVTKPDTTTRLILGTIIGSFKLLYVVAVCCLRSQPGTQQMCIVIVGPQFNTTINGGKRRIKIAEESFDRCQVLVILTFIGRKLYRAGVMVPRRYEHPKAGQIMRKCSGHTRRIELMTG